MLAIHNLLRQTIKNNKAANAFAKLSKCQQFTTQSSIKMIKLELQTLLQSYQNVSNSQQYRLQILKINCCKRFCKVIKMLAIHNSMSLLSQLHRLQTLLQSYQNVSNSQQRIRIFCRHTSCKRFCKVIKMLAIHNYFSTTLIFSLVANAFAKLSKCQQFTTLYHNSLFVIALQTLLQSYQNVSNSQQLTCRLFCRLRCKRFCKVIKMLAIHNPFWLNPSTMAAANAFAKLSKCQQFTTL